MGDWVNHFDEATNDTYNAGIKENLERLGISEESVRIVLHYSNLIYM